MWRSECQFEVGDSVYRSKTATLCSIVSGFSLFKQGVIPLLQVFHHYTEDRLCCLSLVAATIFLYTSGVPCLTIEEGCLSFALGESIFT